MNDKFINNQTFQSILKIVSRVQSEEELQELKDVISNYYARKVDAEMDRLCEEGKITPQTIELWENEHMRTPYK